MPELPEPKFRSTAQHGEIRAAPLCNEPPYAELGVTTNFTFLRGASHPDELAARAAELGYRAIGITDINSLAGVVRLHVAAKELNIKPVIGTRLVFVDHDDLLVWPADRAAYARLCRLLTVGRRRGGKGECLLGIEDFLTHSDGCCAALVPPTEIAESFSSRLHLLKSALASRFSLAAFCSYESDNHDRLNELLSLSRLHGVPLLATNDVHYHLPHRRVLQDVLTCIRHNCRIDEAGFRLFQNGERYLKSPSQMHAIFAACPQAIHRGLEIAEQCTFNLSELRYEYPPELAPAGQTPPEYLAHLARTGAVARYPQGVPQKVHALIERELELIGKLQIEAYFLTVHDLVKFARSRGILCQGRGSAANSAVCYAIGVTSVDPNRIDVLFERFVSAARNEPPDIDIDFEHERREEVIQYIYERYGRERAGMTAEVITYRGRSAIRDVGKALGLGLDAVDQMAKRLDWWDKGRLTPERIREIGLDPDDRTVRTSLDIAAEILGFPRHLSQHVGGMVMTKGPLCEMVPIENAAMADRTVIEWDKQDLDDIGILKVDVLALGMLTCISKALTLLNKRHEGTEARRHEGKKMQEEEERGEVEEGKSNLYEGGGLDIFRRKPITSCLRAPVPPCLSSPSCLEQRRCITIKKVTTKQNTIIILEQPMAQIRTHRDLIAWQLGMKLARAIYLATQRMPKSEQFGLVNQMHRAAVSVPSNIAEGYARQSTLDYLKFLRIARGSLAELSTQLDLSVDLKMLTDVKPVCDLLAEADRVLQGLIRSLEKNRQT